MKNTATSLLCILAAILTSCNKDSAPVLVTANNSWAFNGTSFSATSCLANASSATLTASSAEYGSSYGNLIVYFNDSLPTESGTYKISQYGNSFGKDSVVVSLSYTAPSGAVTYYASFLNTKPDTALVKVTNGKISVSASHLSMISTTQIPSPDTIYVAFNITQQ